MWSWCVHSRASYRHFYQTHTNDTGVRFTPLTGDTLSQKKKKKKKRARLHSQESTIPHPRLRPRPYTTISTRTNSNVFQVPDWHTRSKRKCRYLRESYYIHVYARFRSIRVHRAKKYPVQHEGASVSHNRNTVCCLKLRARYLFFFSILRKRHVHTLQKAKRERANVATGVTELKSRLITSL